MELSLSYSQIQVATSELRKMVIFPYFPPSLKERRKDQKETIADNAKLKCA
jgi:hypothetical protein